MVSKKQYRSTDVLLLGPQVRYMLSTMKTLADEKNVGVDVINPNTLRHDEWRSSFRSRINTKKIIRGKRNAKVYCIYGEVYCSCRW